MNRSDVELASTDDLTQFLELRQTCMPHVRTTRDLLHWQFLENPAGPANMYVIRDGARIDNLPRCRAARFCGR